MDTSDYCRRAIDSIYFIISHTFYAVAVAGAVAVAVAGAGAVAVAGAVAGAVAVAVAVAVAGAGAGAYIKELYDFLHQRFHAGTDSIDVMALDVQGSTSMASRMVISSIKTVNLQF